MHRDFGLGQNYAKKNYKTNTKNSFLVRLDKWLDEKIWLSRIKCLTLQAITMKRLTSANHNNLINTY